VKKFSESVNNWQRCGRKFVPYFLGPPCTTYRWTKAREFPPKFRKALNDSCSADKLWATLWISHYWFQTATVWNRQLLIPLILYDATLVLTFICNKHLTFSDVISSLSKFCYSHIRELRCIRPYLDSKTASTFAASIVHSKLDYCNSLYYNLPKSQINRRQQIQNCLACTAVKASKCSHMIPILKDRDLQCFGFEMRLRHW